MFKLDLETAAANDKPFSEIRSTRNDELMLASIAIFAVNVVTLARHPEHASNLEKPAKDIKRMKYWMPVTIG